MRNRYTVIVLNKKTGQDLFRFTGMDEDERKATLEKLKGVIDDEVTIIDVDEDKIVNNAIKRIIKERYRRIKKDQDEPDKR